MRPWGPDGSILAILLGNPASRHPTGTVSFTVFGEA